MNAEKIIEKASRIVREELKTGYRLFLFGSRVTKRYDDRSDTDIGILS